MGPPLALPYVSPSPSPSPDQDPTVSRSSTKSPLRAPSTGISPPKSAAILTLPNEILRIICVLMDAIDSTVLLLEKRWGEEDCNISLIIPLSMTCRTLRERLRPFIFRSVYNWNREEDVWPESTWGLIRQVTLRDHQIRHPQPIKLRSVLFDTLPRLSALTKAILVIDKTVPSQLLIALSQAPQLNELEIQQARLDDIGLCFSETSFPKLETLTISVWTITTKPTVRVAKIERELHNVILLLQSVSQKLKALKISGDLISSTFLAISWLHLESFAVTEHTPSPYYSARRLISHMPCLKELSMLYTADLTRTDGQLKPPFTYGASDGKKLATVAPRLSSLRLSNCAPEDTIFVQLPDALTGLHIYATKDLYIPHIDNRRARFERPLGPSDVLAVIKRTAYLLDLTDLTLTLNHFPTPALVDMIGVAFPNLEFLELGYPEYWRGKDKSDESQDEAMVESLATFRRLRRLRISIDFEYRDPDSMQTAYHISAAQWYLRRLPILRTISFTFHNWRHTVRDWFAPPVRTEWRTYTREVLLLKDPYVRQPWRFRRQPTPAASESDDSLDLEI
ncbi:hypothetical protein R3P38DRAFT_3346582 [Favolaschia claudopus]|uniref:F-box domain-containing protein n=1 Tax=Favolaschia claudopus TaxID=2862362 RepID=A0AAW0D411_9AGAR